MINDAKISAISLIKICKYLMREYQEIITICTVAPKIWSLLVISTFPWRPTCVVARKKIAYLQNIQFILTMVEGVKSDENVSKSNCNFIYNIKFTPPLCIIPVTILKITRWNIFALALSSVPYLTLSNYYLQISISFKFYL